MNCFVDATSSVGLSAAVRAAPKDWQKLFGAKFTAAGLTPLGRQRNLPSSSRSG